MSEHVISHQDVAEYKAFHRMQDPGSHEHRTICKLITEIECLNDELVHVNEAGGQRTRELERFVKEVSTAGYYDSDLGSLYATLRSRARALMWKGEQLNNDDNCAPPDHPMHMIVLHRASNSDVHTPIIINRDYIVSLHECSEGTLVSTPSFNHTVKESITEILEKLA